jgi:hypothetical protein
MEHSGTRHFLPEARLRGWWSTLDLNPMASRGASARNTDLDVVSSARWRTFELVLHRPCNLKVDLSRSSLEAVEFAAVDEHGNELEICESRGKVLSSVRRQPLREQGSDTLLVPDSARSLVFYDVDGRQVLVTPVRLVPGELTIVYP